MRGAKGGSGRGEEVVWYVLFVFVVVLTTKKNNTYQSTSSPLPEPPFAPLIIITHLCTANSW